MTREEALNIMSQMIKDEEGFLSDNTVEAHKMAIQALSQQPCDDAVSRQAALNSLIDNTHLDGYDLAEALDAIENKEKLPPVTQIPIECDDAISRKLAIRAIKNLYPDIPRVDFNGAKRKWADKYAQYIKCERLIEQLPPVTQKSAESEDKE